MEEKDKEGQEDKNTEKDREKEGERIDLDPSQLKV